MYSFSYEGQTGVGEKVGMLVIGELQTTELRCKTTANSSRSW